MDTTLLPKFIFWCVFAILATVGFFFFARLVSPMFIRAPIEIVRGWMAAYRAWRDPVGERRRRLWEQYLEMLSYFISVRGVQAMLINRPPEMPMAQHRFLQENFDVKAAKELVVKETAPFFIGLTDEDIGCLAACLQSAQSGSHLRSESEIADFLLEERKAIKTNCHLAQEHLDRLDTLLGGADGKLPIQPKPLAKQP